MIGSIASVVGSSPRLRGTQFDHIFMPYMLRFIPASAGNTISVRLNVSASTVHSRVCGEHRRYLAIRFAFGGSSPRLRGTLYRSRIRSWVERFIPASAGNTAKSGSCPLSHPVHPRVCGEHQVHSGPSGSTGGSSPRLRGTPMMPSSSGIIGRFIPASAGNTGKQGRDNLREPVHPRVCGEHYKQFWLRCRTSGSSPRLRGTRCEQSAVRHLHRFIPASAGNTLASS